MIALRPAEAWLTPQQLGEMVDLTVRQLRNLEQRGLPVRGRGRDKRHPLPDAIAWLWCWKLRATERVGRDDSMVWLDLDEALAEWTASNARDAARGPRQRPQYDELGRRLIDEEDFLPGLHVAADPVPDNHSHSRRRGARGSPRGRAVTARGEQDQAGE